MDGSCQEEGRGRSAGKRAAKQVEKLALQLAEVSDKDLAGLPLPMELTEPVRQARTTRGHSSRRRAIKHLAGLLRRDEEAVQRIEEHLAGLSEAHREEQACFHHLETLRDRLCDSNRAAEAISELGQRLAAEELKMLRQYSRAACGGDKGAARKVFRLLREFGETPRKD